MVTITPTSGSVLLGTPAVFQATVQNSTETSVNWSVNGVTGGNATVGTISPAGTYTATADLPTPATVQVTATSQVDPAKSASAAVSITSDITLFLSPNPENLELGASQGFQVSVTSSGHPDMAVRWSLSGGLVQAGAAQWMPAGNTQRQQHFLRPRA